MYQQIQSEIQATLVLQHCKWEESSERQHSDAQISLKKHPTECMEHYLIEKKKPWWILCDPKEENNVKMLACTHRLPTDNISDSRL